MAICLHFSLSVKGLSHSLYYFPFNWNEAISTVERDHPLLHLSNQQARFSPKFRIDRSKEGRKSVRFSAASDRAADQERYFTPGEEESNG